MLLVIVLQSFNITMKKAYIKQHFATKWNILKHGSIEIYTILCIVSIFASCVVISSVKCKSVCNPTLNTKGFAVSQFLPYFFLSFDSFEFNTLKSRNFISSADEKHLTSDSLASLSVFVCIIHVGRYVFVLYKPSNTISFRELKYHDELKLN